MFFFNYLIIYVNFFNKKYKEKMLSIFSMNHFVCIKFLNPSYGFTKIKSSLNMASIVIFFLPVMN